MKSSNIAILAAIIVLCVLMYGYSTTKPSDLILVNHTQVETQHKNTVQSIVDYQNIYRRTSLDANRVEQILKAYNSPAYNIGLGDTLVHESNLTGIDDSVILGIFLQESTLGKYGLAVTTHNVGNIRCSVGYSCYQDFRMYDTWNEGAVDLYNLLNTFYKQELKATTVHDILIHYAPDNENDTSSYEVHVIEACQQWNKGVSIVTWSN